MKKENDIEEIYAKYARAVTSYAMSLCFNPDIASDITADTFVKAINNIDKFNGGNIYTWLCTIAKNTYLDYLRKKERQNISKDELEEKGAEYLLESNDTNINSSGLDSLLIDKERNLKLYKAIQKFDGDNKEIIYLKMFGDLTYAQIGEIIGKSENYVRVTFYRCKIKLKGYLEDEKE